MVSLVWKKFKIFTSPIGLAQGWFHLSEAWFYWPHTSDYLLSLKTVSLSINDRRHICISSNQFSSSRVEVSEMWPICMVANIFNNDCWLCWAVGNWWIFTWLMMINCHSSWGLISRKRLCDLFCLFISNCDFLRLDDVITLHLAEKISLYVNRSNVWCKYLIS